MLTHKKETLHIVVDYPNYDDVWVSCIVQSVYKIVYTGFSISIFLGQ